MSFQIHRNYSLCDVNFTHLGLALRVLLLSLKKIIHKKRSTEFSLLLNNFDFVLTNFKAKYLEMNVCSKNAANVRKILIPTMVD